MNDGQKRLPVIQVFSRPGCHLCEVLLDELLPLIRGRLEVQVLNIETRDEWRSRFELRIPVVVFDDQEICHFKLDKDAVARIVDGNTAN